MIIMLHDVDFSNKRCGRLKIQTHADKGGKEWADICGRPLWMAP